MLISSHVSTPLLPTSYTNPQNQNARKKLISSPSQAPQARCLEEADLMPPTHTQSVTHTFLEDQLAVEVCGVGSHVLLQVRVLVVVDPQALASQQCGHILHHAGLARRGGALQQDGIGPAHKAIERIHEIKSSQRDFFA